MSWKISENSNNIKPAEIDTTSSRVYNYIRRNFVEVQSYDENGDEIGTHWRYEENKVRKEDWETYQQVAVNTSEIADIEDALCDLSKED